MRGNAAEGVSYRRFERARLALNPALTPIPNRNPDLNRSRVPSREAHRFGVRPGESRSKMKIMIWKRIRRKRRRRIRI